MSSQDNINRTDFSCIFTDFWSLIRIRPDVPMHDGHSFRLCIPPAPRRRHLNGWGLGGCKEFQGFSYHFVGLERWKYSSGRSHLRRLSLSSYFCRYLLSITSCIDEICPAGMVVYDVLIFLVLTSEQSSLASRLIPASQNCSLSSPSSPSTWQLVTSTYITDIRRSMTRI
jgi:hypothetical protein